MQDTTSEPHLWTSSSDLFQRLYPVLLLQALSLFALKLSTISTTTSSPAFLLSTIHVLLWMTIWTNYFSAFVWDTLAEEKECWIYVKFKERNSISWRFLSIPLNFRPPLFYLCFYIEYPSFLFLDLTRFIHHQDSDNVEHPVRNLPKLSQSL